MSKMTFRSRKATIVLNFCVQEMAIFGDASLIISIAASEVDLEAGD